MKNKLEFYKNYLLDVVAPFWLKYGQDGKYGGFFTCVEQDGKIYSEDKSVWFQGRATWIYSKIFNKIDPRPEYLEAAKRGYEFLKKCYDVDGRMFFVVTRDARPIRKRRYYFSEAFAAIACAEYHKATGNTEALELARSTFALIKNLYQNPSNSMSKYYKENLNIKAYAAPMILLSTAQVLRSCDSEYAEKYDGFISEMLNEIFSAGYYDEKKHVIFEYVSASDKPICGPKSRLVNPGHAIEGAWFVMIEALHRKDEEMLHKALNIIDWSMELGWDKEYGGLYSFIDIEGKPVEQLEWDMKLWWPHNEGLFANLLAWKVTGDEKYKKWFEMFHEYSFNHFHDSEYGEWFGYLHRDGSVSNTLKGSLFKGPYHLPRMLILAIDLLSRDTLEGYLPL